MLLVYPADQRMPGIPHRVQPSTYWGTADIICLICLYLFRCVVRLRSFLSPHNSGHYTIEACECDQFEMHLRAVLGLPCPAPKMRVGAALMVNILGASDSMDETKALLKKALEVPGAGIHWYGKAESRAGRKMAHLTVTADNFTELRSRVELLGIPAEVHGLAAVGPRVGIIMGSDSDLTTMKDAAEILDNFGVSYELTIVSAHRTPTRMYSYAQTAAERGLQVIIAGAGGAAHLPGMVAALTSLPVVGVPVKTSTLNGNDSLLSIVQMPKGIPVATGTYTHTCQCPRVLYTHRIYFISFRC